MAICIPANLDSLDDQVTWGEKRTFDLLKQLPDSCIIWYELVLQERNYRPDFMILDPKRGVLIVEVKDWSRDSIMNASRKEFLIKFRDNIPARRENPERKCLRYISSAKEELGLIDGMTDDAGHLLVPVEYLIAMPNFSKASFYKPNDLSTVLNPDHILFQEDFVFDVLKARIAHLLPGLPRRLVSAQLAQIRKALRSEINIDTGVIEDGKATTSSFIYNPDIAQTEFAIDLEQEQLAKSLQEGPRLLRGLAGSGKTLILLMRAKYLASNAEAAQRPERTLILCWNISLANYMRQAFDRIRVRYQGRAEDRVTYSTDRPVVEVLHVSAWIGEMYRRYGRRMYEVASKSTEDGDADPHRDQLTQKLQSLQIPPQMRYHYVFIDEAQDFEVAWLEQIFRCAFQKDDPKERHLIISADDAQKIYRHQGQREFSWKQLGIPMQGRSKILRRVYRNSARVWMFAGFVLGDIGMYYVDEDGKSDLSKMWFAPKRGYDPELVHCENYTAQFEEVVKTIKQLQADGYSLRNVLILYRHSIIQRRKGFKLVERLGRYLSDHQIPFDWIAESQEAKGKFDLQRESVKISTVHSAKGMDAPIIIILTAEEFDLEDNQTDELKLLYVAMTRAREYLKILYTEDSAAVQKLIRAKTQYEKNKRIILEAENISAGNPPL